ncbi:molybdenum cofactor biosynthesis protein [Salix suchowensis]|nr:molybdenum cofactor biosynthesis protein [Salix suchowensis]
MYLSVRRPTLMAMPYDVCRMPRPTQRLTLNSQRPPWYLQGMHPSFTSVKRHSTIWCYLPHQHWRALANGTDAVIMVEDTTLVSTDASGEEAEVETLAQVAPGENLRLPGSDARKGDLVLEKGQRLLASGGEIGTLAFVGRKEAFATSSLEGLGYSVIDLGIVTDESGAHLTSFIRNSPECSLNDHVSAIRKGLDSADILLTTGACHRAPFRRNFHFGRITIKPGKPTTFATIPTADGGKKPIFALPGNPASALVTFNVFVVPALRKLGGWPSDLCQLPRVKVKVRRNLRQSGDRCHKDSMKLDTRTEFHRVVVRSTNDGLLAMSTAVNAPAGWPVSAGQTDLSSYPNAKMVAKRH